MISHCERLTRPWPRRASCSAKLTQATAGQECQVHSNAEGASQTGEGAGVPHKPIALADVAFGGLEFLVAKVAHDDMAGGVVLGGGDGKAGAQRVPPIDLQHYGYRGHKVAINTLELKLSGVDAANRSRP